MLGAWGWSYASNKALIASVDASIADYRVAAADELSRTEINGAEAITGDDLGRIATYLAQLRTMPAGYAQRDADTPLGETFGLSQRGLLTAASETTYRNALERMLRSRLILRLEQQITDNINDPMRVYEALKVYLMLGGKAPKVEDDYVVAWMSEDWEENLLPGRTNEEARNELEANLQAMLDLGRSHNPAFELNGDLVTAAQAALARMNMADRAYALIKSSAYSAGLTDFDLAMQAGADARLVFETRDGSDLDQLKIPGLYSYVGFHEFFFKQLGAVAEKLESEHWVMGDAGKQSGVEEQFERLGPELLDIYSKDFIDVWEKALANLKLRSITEDKPDYQVLAALSSDATSPLRQLLESIKAETALTHEREEPAPADGADAATAKPAGGEVAKASPSQTSGLATHRHQPGAEEVAGARRRGEQRRIGERGQSRLQHRGLLQAVSQLGGRRAGQPADRPAARQPQRDPREPAGHRQLSVAGRAGDREAAAGGGQSARHRLAPAEAVCPDDLRDHRRVRGRGRQQLEGADERRRWPTSPRPASGSPPANTRSRATPAPTRRSASSRRCSGRTACWTSSSPTISRRSPTSAGTNGPGRRIRALRRSCRVDTLRQFQRASEIRNAFFPDGGPTPNIQLTIAPNTISRDADMALLEVNQTVLQTSLAGNAPASLTWPGNGGSGTANISLYPEIAGTRIAHRARRAVGADAADRCRHGDAQGRGAGRPLRDRRPRGLLQDQGRLVLQSAVPAGARRLQMPGGVLSRTPRPMAAPGRQLRWASASSASCRRSATSSR